MKGKEMGTSVCKESAEIPAGLVRLNESKEQLHSRIATLSDRLQDVMRKSEPVEKAAENITSLSSQLAMELSAISATIETDLDRINDIIERLEL